MACYLIEETKEVMLGIGDDGEAPMGRKRKREDERVGKSKILSDPPTPARLTLFDQAAIM